MKRVLMAIFVLVGLSAPTFADEAPPVTDVAAPCTPVAYVFRHAEDPGTPSADDVVHFRNYLLPVGKAHAELYPQMISAFETEHPEYCPVAAVYAVAPWKPQKNQPPGVESPGTTNPYYTGRPLANARTHVVLTGGDQRVFAGELNTRSVPGTVTISYFLRLKLDTDPDLVHFVEVTDDGQGKFEGPGIVTGTIEYRTMRDGVCCYAANIVVDFGPWTPIADEVVGNLVAYGNPAVTLKDSSTEVQRILTNSLVSARGPIPDLFLNEIKARAGQGQSVAIFWEKLNFTKVLQALVPGHTFRRFADTNDPRRNAIFLLTFDTVFAGQPITGNFVVDDTLIEKYVQCFRDSSTGGKYACPNSGSGGPELPEAGKFCDREQLEGPTDVLQGTC